MPGDAAKAESVGRDVQDEADEERHGEYGKRPSFQCAGVGLALEEQEPKRFCLTCMGVLVLRKVDEADSAERQADEHERYADEENPSTTDGIDERKRSQREKEIRDRDRQTRHDRR